MRIHLTAAFHSYSKNIQKEISVVKLFIIKYLSFKKQGEAKYIT